MFDSSPPTVVPAKAKADIGFIPSRCHCKYPSGSGSLALVYNNAHSEIISTNCVSTMSANLISQDLLSQCREMTRFVSF